MWGEVKPCLGLFLRRLSCLPHNTGRQGKKIKIGSHDSPVSSSQVPVEHCHKMFSKNEGANTTEPPAINNLCCGSQGDSKAVRHAVKNISRLTHC